MVTTGGRRQGRCMKESNASRSDLGSIVIVIVIFVVIVVIKVVGGVKEEEEDFGLLFSPLAPTRAEGDALATATTKPLWLAPVMPKGRVGGW